MFSQPTLLRKLKEHPEIGSDSDDDEPEVVLPSLKEMIEVCRKLEGDSLLVCKEGALDYVGAVHQLRGHPQKMSGNSAKQTTLEMFFNSQQIYSLFS